MDDIFRNNSFICRAKLGKNILNFFKYFLNRVDSDTWLSNRFWSLILCQSGNLPIDHRPEGGNPKMLGIFKQGNPYGANGPTPRGLSKSTASKTTPSIGTIISSCGSHSMRLPNFHERPAISTLIIKYLRSKLCKCFFIYKQFAYIFWDNSIFCLLYPSFSEYFLNNA